jgi:hypothetical protein
MFAATVTAETDVGVLLLHADDEVITPEILQTGRWEPDEAEWLRRTLHPGWVNLVLEAAR